MTIDAVAMHVADALNAAHVPFMLVGGFSSNHYGIPRSTKDADFVVQLDRSLTADFAQILGSAFEPEPQMSFETNTGTQRQGFRVRGTFFKVEVFRLSSDPHDQERFRRRRSVDIDGHQVFFPTAEDVIIWKLRWARAKDKEDIRAILSVQRGHLDWQYIEHWCEKHRTWDLLQQLRNTIPEV